MHRAAGDCGPRAQYASDMDIVHHRPGIHTRPASRRAAGVRAGLASFAAICCLAVAVAGCATQPPSGSAVRTETAPGTSVASRGTFAWQESGISWPGGAPEGAKEDLRAAVRDAVVAELQSRGYAARDADADFLVSFHVTVRDLPHADLCHLRNDVLSGMHGREVEVCRVTDPSRLHADYRQGTLIVFVVDRREGLLLWQGVAEGTAASRREARTRIRAAIAEMFRDFPARAG